MMMMMIGYTQIQTPHRKSDTTYAMTYDKFHSDKPHRYFILDILYFFPSTFNTPPECNLSTQPLLLLHVRTVKRVKPVGKPQLVQVTGTAAGCNGLGLSEGSNRV